MELLAGAVITTEVRKLWDECLRVSGFERLISLLSYRYPEA